MSSPTQRTLKYLREAGWHAEIVERYNAHTQQRHDLFGFADIIAMTYDQRPLLVQTTSGSNLAARRAKILASPLAKLAIQCGFDIMLQGWTKRKKRKEGRLWYERTETFILEDFYNA